MPNSRFGHIFLLSFPSLFPKKAFWVFDLFNKNFTTKFCLINLKQHWSLSLRGPPDISTTTIYRYWKNNRCSIKCSVNWSVMRWTSALDGWWHLSSSGRCRSLADASSSASMSWWRLFLGLTLPTPPRIGGIGRVVGRQCTERNVPQRQLVCAWRPRRSLVEHRRVQRSSSCRGTSSPWPCAAIWCSSRRGVWWGRLWVSMSQTHTAVLALCMRGKAAPWAPQGLQISTPSTSCQLPWTRSRGALRSPSQSPPSSSRGTWSRWPLLSRRRGREVGDGHTTRSHLVACTLSFPCWSSNQQQAPSVRPQQAAAEHLPCCQTAERCHRRSQGRWAPQESHLGGGRSW